MSVFTVRLNFDEMEMSINGVVVHSEEVIANYSIADFKEDCLAGRCDTLFDSTIDSFEGSSRNDLSLELIRICLESVAVDADNELFDELQNQLKIVYELIEDTKETA